MGWHMILGEEPSLFGCFIWSRNYSMIRLARSCVINVPTAEMAKTVVNIGNCSGTDVDKFDRFGLTATKAREVDVPLIGESYASLECRVHDDRLIRRYSLFVWEIVAAHVAPVRNPRTIHYRGHGKFLLGGRELDLHRHFRPEML